MAPKIIMLGPSGVGKTSLLAAMRKTMQMKTVGSDDVLKLRASADSGRKLDKKWNELADIESGELFEPVPSGMHGTMLVETYDFELLVPGRKPFDVEIVDIRGGMVSDNKDELGGLVKDASVVFHVVDAAAMMELPDARSEVANGIGNITQLLKDKLNNGAMVVSILTKCEAYVPDRVDKLGEVFRSQFKNLRKHLDDKEIPHRIVAVNTLGNIEFCRLAQDDNGEKFVFLKKKRSIEPKAAELPLLLVLEHLYKQARDGRSWLIRMWDVLVRDRVSGVPNLEKIRKEVDEKKTDYRVHII